MVGHTPAVVVSWLGMVGNWLNMVGCWPDMMGNWPAIVGHRPGMVHMICCFHLFLGIKAAATNGSLICQLPCNMNVGCEPVQESFLSFSSDMGYDPAIV